ncbi:MAG: tripartite tricarboxylate transporter TctB family protein [Aestuariibacter sp.]|nr:tripartite tricarboxylate transporter TctB family protein [Aestuariibacter sp.]
MSDKRVRRPGELGFIVILIIFSIGAALQAFGISGFSDISGAGVFPMLAAGTMILSALVIFRNSWVSKSPSTANASVSKQFFNEVTPLRLVTILMMILVYVIAMPMVGFVLSSAGFIFLMLTYLWRKGVIISLTLSAFCLALIYFVFRIVFQVVLPQGSLWQ